MYKHKTTINTTYAYTSVSTAALNQYPNNRKRPHDRSNNDTSKFSFGQASLSLLFRRRCNLRLVRCRVIIEVVIRDGSSSHTTGRDVCFRDRVDDRCIDGSWRVFVFLCNNCCLDWYDDAGRHGALIPLQGCHPVDGEVCCAVWILEIAWSLLVLT